MSKRVSPAELYSTALEALSSDPSLALRLATRAATLFEKAQDWHGAATGWYLSARALRLQSRHREAITTIQKATEYAKRAGDDLLAAKVQIGQVDSLGMLGSVKEAFALGAELIERLHLLHAENEACRVTINLGILHFRQDEYQEALARYAEAATLLVARNDDIVALTSLHLNQANAYIGLGRLDEATTSLERAIQFAKETGNTSLSASADINYAFMLHFSGRHAEALKYLDRARDGFQVIGDMEGVAQCDADFSEVYRALNLIPEALECASRAGEVFLSLEMRYDYGRSELTRAAALRALGRNSDAETALQNAEQAFQQRRYSAQRASVLLLRSQILKAMGEHQTASSLANAAYRSFSKRGMMGMAIEAKYLVAEIALENGDSQAYRLLRSVARLAKLHHRDWLECRAERSLGRCFADKQDWKQALQCFRNSVVAFERVRTLIAPEELHISFISDKLNVYEDAVLALLNQPKSNSAAVAEALEMVERSRSRLLLERVQSALSGNSERPEALLRLGELRKNLSRAYYQETALPDVPNQRRIGKTATSSIEVEQMEREYRTVLRSFETRGNSPLLLSRIPTVEQMSSALHENETLLEFFSTEQYLCAFVLSKRGIVAFPRLARMEDVAYLCRRFRYHLKRMSVAMQSIPSYVTALLDDINEVLTQLYGLLFKPIESHLPSGEIIVVPHGMLHGLPLHALRNGCDYSLEYWEFLYAPSAAVWYATHTNQHACQVAGGSPLIMGVSSMGLMNVAEEIAELTSLFPDSVAFSGEEASVNNFHNHAGSANIIHIAAHAEFRADNPLFSGLQLSDDWLLARDLYGMRLSCDLATLSACQTGTSRVEAGDEMFGLLRGFLSAGARTVVASLWSVDDAATTYLMTRFYTNWGRGLTKSAALRLAQQDTRQVYPHPYYWGAFALVGERGKRNMRIDDED